MRKSVAANYSICLQWLPGRYYKCVAFLLLVVLLLSFALSFQLLSGAAFAQNGMTKSLVEFIVAQPEPPYSTHKVTKFGKQEPNVTSPDRVNFTVSPGETHLVLISAWFDKRLPDVIRINAICTQSVLVLKNSLTCEFFKMKKPQKGKAKGKLTYEKHYKLPAIQMRTMNQMHYGSIKIQCPAPKHIESGSWQVSISWSKLSLTERTPIQRIDIKPDRKLFAMCVQPFSNKTDEHYSLIEMIEFNRMLGASYFYFYDYDPGPKLLEVLQYYAKHTDFVRVIPWKYDLDKMNVTLSAQHAALSDCSDRVMSEYKYMITTDIDEFIVPRANKTWEPFDATFEQMNASQIVFANCFYEPPSNNLTPPTGANSSMQLVPKLRSLNSAMRWEKALDIRYRSKAIALSECIEDHFIHYVDSFLPIEKCMALRTVHVEDTMGIGHLQHYRFEPRVNGESLVPDWHVPKTYGTEIIQAVENALNKVSQTIEELSSNLE